VNDIICASLPLYNHFFISTGNWTKNSISNKDVIRLKVACDVMHLEARPSIYNTAINAFGGGGVNTNMYVSVFAFRTSYFLVSFKNVYPFCLHQRYNIYLRVQTLMNKVRDNKKIQLEATFLPKRKRVLNKRALSVLNTVAKKKKVASKPFHDATHDDLLDSQCSLSSCFQDFSQSQTVSLSSPVVQQAEQQPSKCTIACYFCSCMLCQYPYHFC